MPESNVSLDQPSSVELSSINTQATMTLDWHYREDSFPHIEGHGSADVSISETSISVIMELSETGGHAAVSVSLCTVAIGHADITVHGGGSWLYNWIVSIFSGTIKSAAESVIQRQMPLAIETGINNAFNSFSLVLPLSSQIEVNYALQAPPVVASSYFSLYVLGEFYSVENPQNAPFSPVAMPDFDTTSNNIKMIQMFVSDFTANSATFVCFSENLLQKVITDDMLPAESPVRLNTTFFSELIPAFEKAYPNQMFSIRVYATDTPVTTFTPQGANVIVNGAVDFVVANDTVAFTLGAKVFTTGSAGLSEMNITAQLTYVNASLYLRNSTFGTFDVNVLQEIVGTLANGLLPMANKILNVGFPIPSITGLSLQNSQVGWGNGYLYVSTDATFDPSEIEPLSKCNINVI